LRAPVAAAPPLDAVHRLKPFRNESALDVCLLPESIDYVVEHVRRLRGTGTVDLQACGTVGARQPQQPDGF
jgi:hypothetical protein